MTRQIVALVAAYLVSSTLCTVVVADEEAANRSVVRSSEHGAVYAKSVPDVGYGQKGKTRVFGVAKDRDTLICEYDWYANEFYIGGVGETLVRFGPWHRGHEPQDSHLAVGIYRNGKSLREYTTLEMQRLGSGVSKSKSHYTIFKRRLGFRWLKGSAYAYEIEGVSGKVFSVDMGTGALIESNSEQDAEATGEKPATLSVLAETGIVTVVPPRLQGRDHLLKQWQQLPDRIRKKIGSEISGGKLALSAVGQIQLIGIYNQPKGDKEKPKRFIHLRQTVFEASLLWSVLVNVEDESYRFLFHVDEVGDKDAPWLKLRDG